MNNSVNVQNENNNELKKAILIGIIVSIVGSIVVILILKFLVFGVHKNTTGLSDYKAANVDLNCAYSHNTGDTDISIYSDFIYNYQKSYKLAMAIGLSFTALTLCSVYTMVSEWVKLNDWTALLDVVPYMETALWVFTIMSIVLNITPILLELKNKE